MDFSAELLRFIVCPHCRGDLNYTKEKVLLCVRCRLCFPIEENGVPNLSLEAALPLSSQGKLMPKGEVASFTITSGAETGENIRLEKGNCIAIGRRLDDSLKTQVFNLDFTMSLDDHSKKLVRNYLSKTSSKKSVQTSNTELGPFKRMPDLVLNDTAVSRMHAMIFFDETGAGILDLVSRNGTFVNGKEVETTSLKPGDEIRLGSTVLCYLTNVI